MNCIKYMNRTHKYPIGTTYRQRKNPTRECTVVDQLTTLNSQGEVVSIRYVATHEFMGQLVTDRDVVETSITMGVLEEI